MKLKISQIFKDSLLKNSIYLMMTYFVTSIIGFFFWIIAAKLYTPQDIGITSAIFSSIALISMIGSLGLSRALIYYLPRDKNTDKIINSCLIINIISSIIFSVIFILGLKIWSPELALTLNNLTNIAIFIFIGIAISISGIIGAAFTAGRRSSFQMIKESIYHLIKIFPLIFFVELGAMGIIISLCIGLIISIIIGFILLYKTWNFLPEVKLDPIVKNMMSFSAGNYVADIFYNVPRLILPILILNTLSANSAGYFYIAIMMATLLYGISQAISNSLLVESYDEINFKNNINKAIRFNLIVLVPALLLIAIFGKFILGILNPTYAKNATTTMIILLLSSIPISLINIFNTVRNSQNRVSSMIKINAFIALITILLSMLLIKIMNIEGVAISYLIANIIGSMIIISRMKNPREFTLKILKAVKEEIYSVSL